MLLKSKSLTARCYAASVLVWLSLRSVHVAQRRVQGGKGGG